MRFRFLRFARCGRSSPSRGSRGRSCGPSTNSWSPRWRGTAWWAPTWCLGAQQREREGFLPAQRAGPTGQEGSHAQRAKRVAMPNWSNIVGPNHGHIPELLHQSHGWTEHSRVEASARRIAAFFELLVELLNKAGGFSSRAGRLEPARLMFVASWPSFRGRQDRGDGGDAKFWHELT